MHALLNSIVAQIRIGRLTEVEVETALGIGCANLLVMAADRADAEYDKEERSLTDTGRAITAEWRREADELIRRG
jgi:hypothetical protein